MTRKIIPAIILIIQATCTWATSDPDSLIRVANQAYAANDYSMAAKIYQSVIDSGYGSSGAYYNLGNTYYRMNDYAHAILNYERALLLDPTDKDIRFNLDLANAHTVDKIDTIPEFFLKRWLNRLLILFNTNTWAVISMTAFILLLVFLLVFLFSGKMVLKQTFFYAFLLLILVSAAGFYFSAQSRKNLIDNNFAIIMSPSVTAKSSPDEYGTNLFILHEGTKVEVADSISNWSEIKISNGNKGWVENPAFEKIQSF